MEIVSNRKCLKKNRAKGESFITGKRFSRLKTVQGIKGTISWERL